MIRFLNRIEKPAVAIQFLAGAFLVYHGWSGTPANFFPFLFGIYLLIDVRLHWMQITRKKICVHDRVFPEA